MSAQGTIAIVSHPRDDHALAVMRALVAAGRRVQLIDTADFPARASLTLAFPGSAGPELRFRSGSRDVDLAALDAVWWRRPQPYQLDEDIAAQSAQFAYSECHEAMSGAWNAMECAWVNPPAADEVAHHKPLQLALAPRYGLTIPQTLITNDPAAAREFIERIGVDRLIYKTFLAQEDNWRETRSLSERELEGIDAISLSPTILQEFVEAECDLRVTVFGDEVHATEIVRDADAYRFDYRTDLSKVTMRETRLPSELESRLIAFLRRLDLQYGAIDLMKTAEGRYLFLEVNPSGEFLFVEERTGQRLADAMARLLARLADATLAGRTERRRVA